MTSVFCHLAAAIALFAFSCELLRFFGIADRLRKRISLIATFAWAIHPVHTSTVACISGREDPLAAAFGFLGLFCGLRSLRALKAGAWLWTVGAAAAFLLSVLSKEIGLIFPLLWLVLLGMRRHWIALRNAAVVRFLDGPSNWAIERRYIHTLEDAGEPDRAIAEIKMVLRIQWYRAESQELLSQLLAKAGDADDASSPLSRF